MLHTVPRRPVSDALLVHKSRSGRGASRWASRSGTGSKLFSYYKPYQRWSLSGGRRWSRSGIAQDAKLQALVGMFVE
jgi:hypothetical protein